MPAVPSGFILGRYLACILGPLRDKGKGLTREIIVIHRIREPESDHQTEPK